MVNDGPNTNGSQFIIMLVSVIAIDIRILRLHNFKLFKNFPNLILRLLSQNTQNAYQSLNRKNMVFGKVVRGMNVVETIASFGTRSEVLSVSVPVR